MYSTGTSEEDPRDGGVQEHGEPPGVGSPEEVRGGVAASPAVKDGAPDLGALDVLQRVAIVRRDAGLEEALAQRALPLRHGRAEHQRALHPAVGRVDEAVVPPGGAHVAGAGTGVEAGVEAADDAVLGDEPLRGGQRGRVRQVVLARHVAAAVGLAAALQQEHARALRQRRGQRAARRAAAHHDVVVVGHQRRVPRVPHEPEAVPLRFRRGGDCGDARGAQKDGG